MEYEKAQGNKSKLADLRKRVEEYLTKAYPQQEESSEEQSD